MSIIVEGRIVSSRAGFARSSLQQIVDAVNAAEPGSRTVVQIPAK